MITIFTLLHDKKSKIEKKAIASWKKTGAEILLFKDKDLEKDEYGIPLVGSLLKEAQKKAKGSIVCYVSSDIILPKDFYEWVGYGALNVFLKTAPVKFKELPSFLLVGARHDIQKDGSIRLRGWSGMDYWAFPKGMIKKFPPFVIGRRSFDNYLVWACNNAKIPTIDATQVINIYHQYHKERDYDSFENRRQVLNNLKLAKGKLATIRDCKYELTPYGLKKKNQLKAHLWKMKKLLKKL